MQISKQSTLMILSMALLLAFSTMTGCVSTKSASTSAPVELTDETVRVPPGDPTAFWDSLEWTQMTKAEQALWGVLGWDGASWEGEAKQPASEDKYWRSLNDAERAAAEKLSYNKRTWDNS